MTTHKMHRLQRHKIGRRKTAVHPLNKKPSKRLGGIPVKISKGKIMYAQKVPHNYSTDENGHHYDKESIERSNAMHHVKPPSFIRQHIYETRFAIGEETEDERRKREYKEWMERNL